MRRGAARVLVTTSWLLAIPAAAGPGPAAAQAAPRSDGQPSYGDFARVVTVFPYLAPPARRDRIRASYAELELGATKEAVAAALGPPDYSQLSFTKGPTARWLGSSWTYWLAKRGDGVNSFDPVVQVFFDTSDRATWIVSRNVEGLTEKGGPLPAAQR